MKIDRKLNLVIPIYDAENDEKITAYVHSTPIPTAVFEMHWEVLGVTFNYFYSGGLGLAASARLASKALKKCADKLGCWSGDGGVEQSLLPEIFRLSNVVHFGKSGWTSVLLHDAKKMGLISEDDLVVVESAIVFFTVFSSMHRRQELPSVLGAAYTLWGAQTTSLASTEFTNSLRTSNTSESTGAKAIA